VCSPWVHYILFFDIFQCKWLVFASIKQWPWPKVIPIYVIMTFIYVSLYFVYILFDTTEVNQNMPDSPNTGIQKHDHFRLLRHHYSESPVIPLSNDIWYRCVAHYILFFWFSTAGLLPYTVKVLLIRWHQLSWFLQNALIPWFLNSQFQTLQATINEVVMFLRN
jgi:hypothetical protein